MTNKELKEFLDSDAGKSLKDFVLQECSRLTNIYNVKEYGNAQDQAVEFKAQLKAVKILGAMLGKIMSIDNQELFTKDQYYAGVE